MNVKTMFNCIKIKAINIAPIIKNGQIPVIKMKE